MTAPSAWYEAELLRVVCPEDGGDPFGWIDSSELPPVPPSKGSTRRHSAPQGLSGGIPLPTDPKPSEGHTETRTACTVCGYIPGWVSPRRGAPCGHGTGGGTE